MQKKGTKRDVVAAFFLYFWWQPTHAARAETACGLCRARRRKTSVAKLKAPKPSACRFRGNNLQPALSGRSKNKTMQPPAPGTRAVGCSCSAASENADFLAAFRGERLASRRLRSVLLRKKRYKEVLRAKTAVVLVPLQAIMRRFKTASRGDAGILREHATRASRSRQSQPKSRVSSGSARCCGTPRDRPRSEARYTRCGPIRCTRSAKRR